MANLGDIPSNVAVRAVDLPALEAWRNVGAVGQPVFENGWVAYGGTHAVPAFYKDQFGWVHVKGLIRNGTMGVAAFTLPVGYRPASNLSFNVAGNYPGNADNHGQVDVNSTGAVVPLRPGNGWMSLAGVSFVADGALAFRDQPANAPLSGRAFDDSAWTVLAGGVSYRRDALGVVHLSGVHSYFGNAPPYPILVGTLPVGYRPDKIQVIAQPSSRGAGGVA